MSEYSILDPILKEILDVIQPLREDWEVRVGIINELRNVVESVENLRGAIVEPFGSFVSNLFTRWGDLDISVEVPNGAHISSAGRKRKQTLLGELLRALRGRGGLRRFQFIPNARVPILKFESNCQSISCDISIDNMAGLMKSRFLFWINTIDGRFRDMVLLVKEWSKTHDINNPKSGSFNSYSLSLLVIFHFQTCVPPILPPLIEIYPGNLVDDLKGVRANAERNIAEICAAHIARFKSRNRIINRSSLAQLFVTFVGKFSDLHLKAPELGICPFTGRWEKISTITRWLPNNHAIFIEDPFEQPENSARAVSAKQLEKIAEAFAKTHLRLVSTNQNKYSLLTTLTRPQISQLLARPPVRYLNYYDQQAQHLNGQQVQHHRAQSQMVRQAVHSPSRVPNQYNKMRPESRPNQLPVQQPGQPYQNQPQILRQHPNHVQQIWRPKSEK